MFVIGLDILRLIFLFFCFEMLWMFILDRNWLDF